MVRFHITQVSCGREICAWRPSSLDYYVDTTTEEALSERKALVNLFALCPAGTFCPKPWYLAKIGEEEDKVLLLTKSFRHTIVHYLCFQIGTEGVLVFLFIHSFTSCSADLVIVAPQWSTCETIMCRPRQRRTEVRWAEVRVGSMHHTWHWRGMYKLGTHID